MNISDSEEKVAYRSKLDLKNERQHEREIIRLKQNYRIRMATLFILGIAGLGLLGFGAFIAYLGHLPSNLILMFLISGVVLLAFGVTVAMSGIYSKPELRSKEISNKVFFNELDKK